MDLSTAIVRPLTRADRQQITEIVRSNPTMYGTNITHFHPMLIERFMLQPKSEVEQARWGVELHGKLIGLAIQFWWVVMPMWSIGGLFFRNEEGVNQFNAVKVGAVLVNKMIETAEARGLYDFCYVIRDSGGVRKKMSYDVNDALNRYDIFDMAVIKPGEIPKYSAHKLILGMVAGVTKKPVVIRHAHLKLEHRPQW